MQGTRVTLLCQGTPVGSKASQPVLPRVPAAERHRSPTGPVERNTTIATMPGQVQRLVQQPVWGGYSTSTDTSEHRDRPRSPVKNTVAPTSTAVA